MVLNRSDSGTSIPVKTTGMGLGLDWKSDHRPLSDSARSTALAYIEAIAQHLRAKGNDEASVERTKVEL